MPDNICKLYVSKSKNPILLAANTCMHNYSKLLDCFLYIFLKGIFMILDLRINIIKSTIGTNQSVWVPCDYFLLIINQSSILYFNFQGRCQIIRRSDSKYRGPENGNQGTRFPELKLAREIYLTMDSTRWN